MIGVACVVADGGAWKNIGGTTELSIENPDRADVVGFSNARCTSPALEFSSTPGERHAAFLPENDRSVCGTCISSPCNAS